MPFHLSVRAIMLALLLLAAGPSHAAPETDLRPRAPPKKRDEIRVPIPGWSPEVAANGCHARRSADEVLPGGQQGGVEIPFLALIDRAVRRYAVQATRNGPEAFLRTIAALDEDLRRLTLLFTLWDGFGHDGLHTFFFLESGDSAPAIRDALQETGLAREFELFSRAMALFGVPYPVSRDVRKQPFGYSRPGGRLNAFDLALLPIAQAFGTKEAFARRIVDYVNRTPALFARVEALRRDSARTTACVTSPTLSSARSTGASLISGSPPCQKKSVT